MLIGQIDILKMICI